MSEGVERRALIFGASGLIGGLLVNMALSHQAFAGVTAVTRRRLDIHHPLLRNPVVDFADLAGHADALTATDVFCALGTTLRAAGSRASFRTVDHDYIVAAARLARARGAARFMLVSSAGARAGAPNFYLGVKGETEEAGGRLGFPTLHIFRPGLLLARREESRPGERFGVAVAPWLGPLMVGGLRKYRGIHPETVAAAMIGASMSGMTGTHIHHNDDMLRLTAEF